jgi:hypothetical protein
LHNPICDRSEKFISIFKLQILPVKIPTVECKQARVQSVVKGIMKFGKVLKTWAEMPENSENTDLVLRFKELKKQLKLVKPADPGEVPL